MPTDTYFKSQNKNPEAVHFCVHVGPSMNPALKELDVLEIVPYLHEEAKCGDVISFVPPKGNQAVVHRIIRITSQGVCTRGDNNNKEDPWLVPHGRVGGKVVTAWRGRKRRRIHGGKKALLTACTIRRLRSLKGAIFHAARPVYRGVIARQGLIRCLVPARFQPRVVLYQSKGRYQLKLVIAGRIVGHYDNHLHQWHIKQPFRLLVNSAALTCPSGPTDGGASLG